MTDSIDTALQMNVARCSDLDRDTQAEAATNLKHQPQLCRLIAVLNCTDGRQ
jgi:hypothetical protein